MFSLHVNNMWHKGEVSHPLIRSTLILILILTIHAALGCKRNLELLLMTVCEWEDFRLVGCGSSPDQCMNGFKDL